MPAPPSAPHRSVLLEEALAALSPRPGGVYCDVTVGAGGHTEQLLIRSAPGGRVFGIDRDQSALAIARERLARFGDRFVPLHGPFGEAAALLAAGGAPPLDGLLADLGVSSMQLDRAERGFSLQGRGPIDMRMDPSQGETALELISRLGEETLTDILLEYGEERFARRIARALKQAASEGLLTDTLALAEITARAVPTFEPGKHKATRTFQALRMAVNDELRQIHRLLSDVPRLLAPGGRVAVISFHSLEDRLVKQHLHRGTPEPGQVQGQSPAAAQPSLQPLSKKPIYPGEQELSENPRSRSARMRAARLVDADDDTSRAPGGMRRTEAPAWPR